MQRGDAAAPKPLRLPSAPLTKHETPRETDLTQQVGESRECIPGGPGCRPWGGCCRDSPAVQAALRHLRVASRDPSRARPSPPGPRRDLRVQPGAGPPTWPPCSGRASEWGAPFPGASASTSPLRVLLSDEACGGEGRDPERPEGSLACSRWDGGGTGTRARPWPHAPGDPRPRVGSACPRHCCVGRTQPHWPLHTGSLGATALYASRAWSTRL